MSKRYEVKVTRDGRWWMIEVPELDVLTQARRLAEVEEMATSVVAVTLDVPASQVALDLHVFVSGEDLTSVRQHVAGLRRQAQEAEEAATTAMRKTATSLAAEDVPLRDIGEVLGVSHQRVGQLLNA